MKNFFVSLNNLIKFLSLDVKKKEFVFYSESKFYREYYLDLVLNLKKKGQSNIVIVTSDKEDIFFFKHIVKCFYINHFLILNIFFKLLNCKFMIMTLTDLGKNFQKSNLCKNYVYYFHAIASTHKIYTNSAFKNYDIIFANGQYQSDELRLVEKKLNYPNKEIVNTGYFFLDHIQGKAKLDYKEKRHILFAPSWNYNQSNLFDDFSTDIISILLSNNFTVTLRPHPEHYKRSILTINKINNLFQNNKNFSLNKSLSNLKSLEKAEILITDNSSIVFEYMFVFKRPIVYLDYKDKIHNIDQEKIKILSIDDDFKNTFGNLLNVSKLNDLPSLCENLIKKNNLSTDLINSFLNKYLSNLNCAADFASDYLINKSKNK